MRDYWVKFSILLFLTPVAQRKRRLSQNQSMCGFLLTETLREQLPPGVPIVNSKFWPAKICAAVAQRSEVLVLETRGCGYRFAEASYDSHQQYQASGCSSAWLRVTALEAEGRRFKSYHPDHLPL